MNSFERNNVSFGIIISGVITFLLYIILSPLHLRFGIEGDIFVIIGTIFGCYFSFKYRKKEQTLIRLGIIVGIGGALMATIIISFYYFIFYPNILYFLILIFSFIVFYLLFGFTTGYIMAMIYLRKEEKPKTPKVKIKGLEHLEEE